ncbi:MAG: diguanylate cyclase [Nitrospiraceae bacterium]|nr:diguanylate cyclase [Nitrospiraceae bacterium]
MKLEKRFNFIILSIFFLLIMLSVTSFFAIISDEHKPANVVLFTSIGYILLTVIGFLFIKTYLSKRLALLRAASEKEQSVIRELSMLNEMIGFVTSEMKFDTIIERLLEMTKNLMKAEHCGIFLFEGEKSVFKLFKTTLKEMEEVSPECIKAMLTSPLGKVISEAQPLRINNFKKELPFGHIQIKNVLALPLSAPDKNISALLVAVNRKDGFTQDDEDTLFSFAFQAFQALMMNQEIAKLAVTDGLTGLSNHRTFQEILHLEVEKAKRYNKTLPILMLDIDHFKYFNDTFGHQTGDDVLKTIAKIVKNSIRNVDFAARYGGEEFVVLLPDTGFDGAVTVAERIRNKVNNYHFPEKSDKPQSLTVSIGVAYFPLDAAEAPDIVRKADQALYFAKHQGRNKVCTYQDLLAGAAKEIPEELDEILKDPDLKHIEKIGTAIDSKSNYTKDHSLEVAAYATMLGKKINLDENEIASLKVASMLHDIGNIGIPDHILNKTTPLTNEEKSIIQGHPALAEMVLKRYPHVEDIVPAILYHHERYDGNGYPLGLKGDQIPLLARILSIVEAYQAMLSPRPYRKRMSKNEAIEELKTHSGTQFDPMIANAFIQSLGNDKDL